MIRLAIVDDQALIRAGLARILSPEDGFEAVVKQKVGRARAVAVVEGIGGSIAPLCAAVAPASADAPAADGSAEKGCGR